MRRMCIGTLGLLVLSAAPVRAATYEVPGEECQVESQRRSGTATGQVGLLVTNETSYEMRVYRVSATGQRELAMTLFDGQSLSRRSMESEVLVVTIAGQCRGVYTIPPPVKLSQGSGWIRVADPYRRRQYFAEGATNAFFRTQLALANPTETEAGVVIRFQTSDGRVLFFGTKIFGRQRRTYVVNDIPGLEDANFATVVESDVPLAIDRTMTWDGSGYGSHAEAGVAGPSTTWYLAEGATTGQFSLFYLLQNPNDGAVTATIRYLRPGGLPVIEQTKTLPPRSRTTVAVDTEAAELAATDVSAVILASQPIIVERAMYKDVAGQPFGAGHESAGITAPATNWFLAEGATGSFFDLFVLIANPHPTPVDAAVEYLLSDGRTFSKRHTLAAYSRSTIWVDDETIPGLPGKPLADVAVSTTVTASLPVVVERSMWWPGPAVTTNYWSEAHNSAGSTETGTAWSVAEGEVGGSQATQTYLLIANTSTTAGNARVALLFENGDRAERTFGLLPKSRRSIDVGTEFPAAAGRRFGASIESLGSAPAQIVVERAMYTSPGGTFWAAGTNAGATKTDPRTLAPARPDICRRSSDCPIWTVGMCGNNYGAPIYECQYVPEWPGRMCMPVATCPDR